MTRGRRRGKEESYEAPQKTQTIRARRALGQNFILDGNLMRRIAGASGPFEGVSALEIGAGQGGLTRALLEEGAEHVVALEKDLRFLPLLRDLQSAHARLSIIAIDALSFPLKVFLEARPKTRIAANLPFNIAAPLLAHWLTCPKRPLSITVLLQEEVAMRIASPPGSKNYGRFSILCQALAKTNILFRVPKTAFTPRPKIDARLLRFEPQAHGLLPSTLSALQQITAAAFSQRRKKLRTGLKDMVEDASAWIKEAELDPELRPEAISPQGFCRLAHLYESFRSK